ncbi:hypothetical protein QTP86_017944, partial [Hemibagrus guttatus]
MRHIKTQLPPSLDPLQFAYHHNCSTDDAITTKTLHLALTHLDNKDSYRGTIESILSSCITARFGNCTVLDRKTLQRIVKTAEKIIGVSLPSITDICTTCCLCKANSIVDGPTHPSHTLFTLLLSGK